jgi:mono/diheme cytochrome c family protein
MTPARLTRAPLYATVVWFGLTFTVAAMRAAPQAPAGAEGWQIPEGAAAETNPVPTTADVLAKGMSLYRAKCQRCHGADGTGHGPEADPGHPPADLTDGRRAFLNPDGVMFYKIWNGRAKPKMPAMKSDMAPADVWTVIQYVKTLRK